MAEYFNDKFQVQWKSLIKTLQKKKSKSINIQAIYKAFSSFKFKDELFLMCIRAM